MLINNQPKCRNGTPNNGCATQKSGDERKIVEPFLGGFENFVSNDGVSEGVGCPISLIDKIDHNLGF